MENLNILLEDLAISMARMKDNHELLNRKMTLIRVDFSKDPLLAGEKAIDTLKRFIECEEKNTLRLEEKIENLNKYDFYLKNNIINQCKEYLTMVKDAIKERRENVKELEEMVNKAKCSINMNMIILLTLLNKLGGK